MHQFPAPDVLRFLIGLEVEQVRLDPWTIQLRFSEGGQITIAGEFHHTDTRRRLHIHHAGEERDTGPVYLRELLQQRIVDLSVMPLQLTMSFTNGAALNVLTNEAPFECGQIYPPDQPDQPIVF